MALRAAHSSNLQTGISPGKAIASALAALSLFWSDPQEPPLLEREKRIELFTPARITKPSISLAKMTRTEGGHWIPALMGVSAEEAANKRVISILFLSIRQTARKTSLDKFPIPQIATITLPELFERYGQAFVVKWNRTLDRFRFFSRKQETNESLQQFWNALNGLAVSSKNKPATWCMKYSFWNAL